MVDKSQFLAHFGKIFHPGGRPLWGSGHPGKGLPIWPGVPPFGPNGDTRVGIGAQLGPQWGGTPKRGFKAFQIFGQRGGAKKRASPDK